MTKYWLGKTRDKTMWNRDDWIKYYQDKITGRCSDAV